MKIMLLVEKSTPSDLNLKFQISSSSSSIVVVFGSAVLRRDLFTEVSDSVSLCLFRLGGNQITPASVKAIPATYQRRGVYFRELNFST
jgi:hypothetical protein